MVRPAANLGCTLATPDTPDGEDIFNGCWILSMRTRVPRREYLCQGIRHLGAWGAILALIALE